MSFFKKLHQSVENKFNESFIKKLIELYEKINKQEIFHENELNKLENECIEYFEAACKIEKNNVVAMTLWLLGYYYQSRVRLMQVRLFKVIVSPDDYEYYLKAIHLYNACWNYICGELQNKEMQEKLYDSFKQTQFDLITSFLRCVGNVEQARNIKKISDDIKIKIDSQRDEAVEKYQSTTVRDKEMYSIYEETTKFHNNCVRDLIKVCVDAVVTNSEKINYAILALGSPSRKEATLRSDIEFLILLPNIGDKDLHKDIIYAAIQLMQLVVISFNETLVPPKLFTQESLINQLKKIKVKRGFAFDGGGRTALGEREVYGDKKINYKVRLIGDIWSIIRYMVEDRRLDYKAKCEFSQFTIVKPDDDYKLVIEYANRLGDYLSDKFLDLSQLIVRKVGLPDLKKLKHEKEEVIPLSMNIFSNDYWRLSNPLAILVKHHIYRPLERLVDALWLMFEFKKHYVALKKNLINKIQVILYENVKSSLAFSDQKKDIYSLENTPEDFKISFIDDTMSKIPLFSIKKEQLKDDKNNKITLHDKDSFEYIIELGDIKKELNEFLSKDGKGCEVFEKIISTYWQYKIVNLFNLSTKEKLDYLKKESIDENTYKNFCNYLELILKLRLDVYNYYNGAQEDIVIPNVVAQNTKNPLYLVSQHNLINETTLGEVLVFIYSGYHRAKLAFKDKEKQFKINSRALDFSELGDEVYNNLKEDIHKLSKEKIKELCNESILRYEQHLTLTNVVPIEISEKLLICYLLLNKYQEGFKLLDRLRALNDNKKDVRLELLWALFYLLRSINSDNDHELDLLEAKKHAEIALVDLAKGNLSLNCANGQFSKIDFGGFPVNENIMLYLLFLHLIKSVRNSEDSLNEINSINGIYNRLFESEKKNVYFILEIILRTKEDVSNKSIHDEWQRIKNELHLEGESNESIVNITEVLRSKNLFLVQISEALMDSNQFEALEKNKAIKHPDVATLRALYYSLRQGGKQPAWEEAYKMANQVLQTFYSDPHNPQSKDLFLFDFDNITKPNKNLMILFLVRSILVATASPDNLNKYNLVSSLENKNKYYHKNFDLLDSNEKEDVSFILYLLKKIPELKLNDIDEKGNTRLDYSDQKFLTYKTNSKEEINLQDIVQDILEGKYEGIEKKLNSLKVSNPNELINANYHLLLAMINLIIFKSERNDQSYQVLQTIQQHISDADKLVRAKKNINKEGVLLFCGLLNYLRNGKDCDKNFREHYEKLTDSNKAFFYFMFQILSGLMNMSEEKLRDFLKSSSFLNNTLNKNTLEIDELLNKVKEVFKKKHNIKNEQKQDRKLALRDKESKILASLLSKENIVFVRGDTAVGKTSFVRITLNKHFSKNYNVIWINASSRSSLNSHYASLIDHSGYMGAINIYSIEDITKRVFNQLIQDSLNNNQSDNNKPLIFVYDNVSSMSAIKDYLPVNGQHLGNVLNRFIVISRERLQLPNPIELKRLSGNAIRLSPGIKQFSAQILEKGKVEKEQWMDSNNPRVNSLCVLSFFDTEHLHEFIINNLPQTNQQPLISNGYIERQTYSSQNYFTMHSCLNEFLKKEFLNGKTSQNVISRSIQDVANWLFYFYCEKRTDFHGEQALLVHLNSAYNKMKEIIKDNYQRLDKEVFCAYGIIVGMLNMLSHEMYGCDLEDLEYLERALSILERELIDYKLKDMIAKEKYNLRDSATLKEEESSEKSSSSEKLSIFDIVKNYGLNTVDQEYLKILKKITLLIRVIGFIYLEKSEHILALVYLSDALFFTQFMINHEKDLNSKSDEQNKERLEHEHNFSLAISYRDLSQGLFSSGLFRRAAIYAEKGQEYLERSYSNRNHAPYRLESAICFSVISKCYYEIGDYERARQFSMRALTKKLKIFTLNNDKSNPIEVPTSHLEIAITQINLATALGALGSTTKAKQILKEVRSYIDKKLGSSSKLYITSNNCLAAAYYSLALDAFEKNLPSEHSDSNLPLKKSTENDLVKKYLNQAYEMCKTSLDHYKSSHPLSLNYINMLLLFSEIALFYYLIDQLRLDDLLNSIEAKKEAYEKGVKLVSEEYLAEAVAWHIPPGLFLPTNLFSITNNLRKHQEFFVKLFYITRAIYGDSHVAVARRYYELGRVYYDDENIRAKFFSKSNEILKKNNMQNDLFFDKQILRIIKQRDKTLTKSENNESLQPSLIFSKHSGVAMESEIKLISDFDKLDLPDNYLVDDIFSTDSDDFKMSGRYAQTEYKLVKEIQEISRKSTPPKFQLETDSEMVHKNLHLKDIKFKYIKYLEEPGEFDISSADTPIMASHSSDVPIVIEYMKKWYPVISVRTAIKDEIALSNTSYTNNQWNEHIALLSKLGNKFRKNAGYHHSILYFHRQFVITVEKNKIKQDLDILHVALTAVSNIAENWLNLNFNNRALIYLIALFCFLNEPKHIFSDQNVMKNINKNDISKFLRIFALSLHYMGKSKIAIKLLKDLGTNKGWDGYDYLKIKFYSSKKFEKVDEDLMTALSINENKGTDKDLSIHATSLRGDYYFRLYVKNKNDSDYKNALDMQNKALTDLHIAGKQNMPRYAIVCTRLATLLFWKGVLTQEAGQETQLINDAKLLAHLALSIYTSKYNYTKLDASRKLDTYLILSFIFLEEKNYQKSYYYLLKSKTLGFFHYGTNLHQEIINTFSQEIFKRAMENAKSSTSKTSKKIAEILGSIASCQEFYFDTPKLPSRKSKILDKDNNNTDDFEHDFKKNDIISIMNQYIDGIEETGTYEQWLKSKLKILANDLDYDLMGIDSKNRTLFYEICCHGNITLLRNIGELLQKNKMEGRQNNLLELLINRSALDGSCPLILAAEMNRFDIVKWMIDNGAEVNVYKQEKYKKDDGQNENIERIATPHEFYCDTPLYFAVVNENLAMVKELLNAGATVDWLVNGGYSLLHICLQRRSFNIGNDESVKICDEILKQLLNYVSEDILTEFYNTQYGKWLITLFHQLIFSDACEQIKLLLKAETSQNKKGYSQYIEDPQYKRLAIDLYAVTLYGHYPLQLARTIEMQSLLYEAYRNELTVGLTNSQEIYDVISKEIEKLSDHQSSKAQTEAIDIEKLKSYLKILCKFAEADLKRVFIFDKGDTVPRFQEKYIVNRLLRLAASIAYETCSSIVSAILLESSRYEKLIEYENSFYGSNPFYSAIYGGNLEILKVLLNNYKKNEGKNFNLCFSSTDKWTPLMQIAMRNYRGGGPNGEGSHQNLLAELFKEKSCLEENVEMLSNSYLDQVNKNEESALYIAIINNNQEIVKMLLGRGASIFPYNEGDKQLSPVSRFLSSPSTSFFNNDIFKSKPEFGWISRQYCSPLHAAARLGSAEILTKMFEKKANAEDVEKSKLQLQHLLSLRLGSSKYNVFHQIVLSEDASKKIAIDSIYNNVSTIPAKLKRSIFSLISRNPYLSLKRGDKNVHIKDYSNIYNRLKGNQLTVSSSNFLRPVRKVKENQRGQGHEEILDNTSPIAKVKCDFTDRGMVFEERPDLF